MQLEHTAIFEPHLWIPVSDGQKVCARHPNGVEITVPETRLDHFWFIRAAHKAAARAVIARVPRTLGGTGLARLVHDTRLVTAPHPRRLLERLLLEITVWVVDHVPDGYILFLQRQNGYVEFTSTLTGSGKYRDLPPELLFRLKALNQVLIPHWDEGWGEMNSTSAIRILRPTTGHEVMALRARLLED